MIPIKILSKMGVYDINVNGCDLKVRVVDHAEMISQGISELRSQITGPMPVVGINIFSPDGTYNLPLLQLCVGNRCLIVVSRYVNPFPVSLKEFLDDPNICFVGFEMDSSLPNGLRTHTYEHEFARGMDVKEFAARALKKPNVLDGRFSELAAEVGICLDISGDFKVLKALSSTTCVFSHKQIECLAPYPYAAYLIGQKMLSLL